MKNSSRALALCSLALAFVWSCGPQVGSGGQGGRGGTAACPNGTTNCADACVGSCSDASAGGSGGGGGTAGNPGDASLSASIELSPPSGTFQNSLTVSMTARPDGAEIRYTTNGTFPTAASTRYSGTALRLTRTTQIIAQVYINGTAVGEPTVGIYVARSFDVTVDLPIVVLDSYGAGVPEGTGGGAPGAPRPPREYFDAAMLVYQTSGSRLSERPTMATRSAFRLRGQSSAMFPKPPYRLELRDAHGEDTKHALLGMPEDGDWVLRNPHADKALIRDAFFYGLGREIGLKTPRFAFCELYRNGDAAPVGQDDYLGVYLLMERIENSKSRLDLKQLEEEDRTLPKITGGYIFKLEWRAAEEPIVECSGSSNCWRDLEVVDPDSLVAEQEAWLAQHLRGFVDALYGPNFADPTNGYARYIDMRSFLDQVIVNELGRNMDAYVRSQHFYKDRGDNAPIFAGPLWDYDLVFGVGGFFQNQNVQGWQYDQVRARTGASDWFPRLVQDPAFVRALAARWKELRTGPLSDAALGARIDALTAPLAAAAARNFQRWPILAQAQVGPFRTPTAGTWQGQIASLRDWMQRRVAWLDTQWR
jgi:hypothetical protein